MDQKVEKDGCGLQIGLKQLHKHHQGSTISLGSLLQNCIFDAFWTLFWTRKGPFSSLVGIFGGLRQVSMSSKQAENTCLGIPMGLGSCLQKCCFGLFYTLFWSRTRLFLATLVTL